MVVNVHVKGIIIGNAFYTADSVIVCLHFPQLFVNLLERIGHHLNCIQFSFKHAYSLPLGGSKVLPIHNIMQSK